ncbi:MAG: IS200/IS605 family transposase [Bacteroidales bacterium]|nr:IS200/IS605 family transposase [Bacteroidales bacterium]
MANTYSQIYIMVVFAVQNRKALILPSFEERLYKYITGIVQNQGQKLLAINGTTDHIHIFFGMKPTCRLSDLVRDIKSDSSVFIKENKLSRFKFNWQEGYGAFSYSYSQKQDVIEYVMNQKKHHKKRTFRQEYLDFLKKFNVDYNEKYLFDFFD